MVNLKKQINVIRFTSLLVLALLLLIFRLDGTGYFPGKYLWAEDGVVFINQAQLMGIFSVLKPYAGYLQYILA